MNRDNGHNGTTLDSLACHRTAQETVYDLTLSDLHFRALQGEQIVSAAEARAAMRKAINLWLQADGYELRAMKGRGKR